MPPIIYRGGVKWEHWKEDVKRFHGGLHNLQRKLMMKQNSDNGFS